MAKANGNKSKLPAIPSWLIYLIIISVVASWVPLSMIALSRVQRSPQHRIQIFQDMGVQPRYEAQATSDLFADGRAMRQPVDGTVARGELQLDDHYYYGYQRDDQTLEPITEGEEPAYFDDLPDQLEVNTELLQHGQTQFNIACAPCHGQAGYGDGLVNRRVQRLKQQMAGEGDPAPGWVPPVNLHARSGDGLTYGGDNYAAGRLFHVISDGVRTMPAYADQLSVQDRWAVVAYVQALQLSQAVPVAEVPEGVGPLGEPIDPAPSAAAAGDVQIDTAEVDLDDPELIAQGQQFFATKGCVTCHQTNPNIPAPTAAANLNGPSFAEGLFGQQRSVHTGGPGGEVETIEADSEYFVESLLQPQAKIVQDFGPPRMMPPAPVNEEEITALMAYIRSLGDSAE